MPSMLSWRVMLMRSHISFHEYDVGFNLWTVLSPFSSQSLRLLHFSNHSLESVWNSFSDLIRDWTVALTWNRRSRVSKCWQKEALCHLAEMICLEAKWIQSLPSKSKSKKMRVLVTVGTTKFPELVASAVDPDVTSLLSSMGYNHMEIQVGL